MTGIFVAPNHATKSDDAPGAHEYMTEIEAAFACLADSPLLKFAPFASTPPDMNVNLLPGSVSNDFGAFGITQSKSVSFPGKPVIAPDGKNLYVPSGSGGVSIKKFSIDLKGVLTEIGEISSPPADIADIVMSPDGKHVYCVGSIYNGGFIGYVMQYSRNEETGLLTALSPEAIPLGAYRCESVEISPDGKHVYVGEVGTSGYSVYIFGRDAVTGLLTLLSTLTVSDASQKQFIISPDGMFVYISCEGATRYTYQYSRDSTTGVLTPLSPASVSGFGAQRACISPDGKYLYSVYSGGVRVATRDDVTGLLTLGSVYSCHKNNGDLVVPEKFFMSQDGKIMFSCKVAVAEAFIFLFARDESTGELTALQDYGRRQQQYIYEICFSPNGKDVYLTSYINSLISHYVLLDSNLSISSERQLSDSRQRIDVFTQYIPLTAPISYPRIDAVGVDALTGTLVTIKGSESASPVAPAFSDGVLPICFVALAVGQTAITNGHITDVRCAAFQDNMRGVLGGGGISDAVSKVPYDLFAEPGAYQVEKPANAKFMRVYMAGGGGGRGAHYSTTYFGGGGGAGGYVNGLELHFPDDELLTVVVGAAGINRSTQGVAGTAGGVSSITFGGSGYSITTNGGNGGGAATASAGGAAGAGGTVSPAAAGITGGAGTAGNASSGGNAGATGEVNQLSFICGHGCGGGYLSVFSIPGPGFCLIEWF